jgi:hypothetical protein
MAATDIDLHQAHYEKRDFRPLADITPIVLPFSSPAFHRSCCIAVTILLSKVPTTAQGLHHGL